MAPTELPWRKLVAKLREKAASVARGCFGGLIVVAEHGVGVGSASVVDVDSNSSVGALGFFNSIFNVDTGLHSCDGHFNKLLSV